VIKAEFVNEKNPFFGKKGQDDKVDNRETRDMVKTILEAVDDEYLGARVWANFGASIHERSKLRPFINACGERDLTTDELKKFNIEDLKGRYVQVFGSYAEGDAEQKYLRPDGFLRASKAQIKAAEKNEDTRAKARAERPKATAASAATAGTVIDF
jgi:hypothetical protein